MWTPKLALPGVQISVDWDEPHSQIVYKEVTPEKTTVWKFNDFQQPSNPKGTFLSYSDSTGISYSVASYNYGIPQELIASYTSPDGSKTIYYSLYFTMTTDGTMRVANITLSSSPDTSTWTPIRSVNYSYYKDGDTTHGMQQDLEYATICDGLNRPIDTYYYRYYTSGAYLGYGTGPGYVGSIKFVLNPRSYARLVAAYPSTNIDTLSDTTVQQYADMYFSYDNQARVVQEQVQGTSCSCGGGSSEIGIFNYTYTINTNSGYSDGYNTWKYKTVETLPDNATANTLYFNYQGQLMLKVFSSGGQNWATYNQYDSNGNLIMEAEPSAVVDPTKSPYSDTYDAHFDLLDKQTSGAYQYLNQNSGLIHIYDYCTSTTPSAGPTTPGTVLGYLEDEQVQQGQQGSPIEVRSQLYFAHPSDLATANDGQGPPAYPIASKTEYNSASPSGSGGQVTTYWYTWQTLGGLNTTMPATRSTTRPTISSAENGPGTSDISTEVYDTNGLVEWTQDPDGHLNFLAHDLGTRAVVTQIIDVNTSSGTQPSDYVAPPTSLGWSTSSGLNLVTSMTVDGLGRTTSITDPNENTTYTVYNDYQQNDGTVYEVRNYPGWSSGQTTGPVRVQKEIRPTSYASTYNNTAVLLESLTMAPSSPTTSGGIPTGQEGISNVQALLRQIMDQYANRPVYADQYYSFASGGSTLSYSTSPTIGVQDTNYYRTSYYYDALGRRYKSVSDSGTITNRAIDPMGRTTSIWIGTNDSGWTEASGNSGSSNMTMVSSSQYDGGGVGDSTLTQITNYVDSTSSDNRVTQNWYDWRDRLVGSKLGVASSESDGTHRPITFNVLDNLGRIIERDRYDGDGWTPTVSSGAVSIPSGDTGNLRSKVVVAHDDQNRVYQTEQYSVDQSSGAVSSTALVSNVFYDHRGNLIETSNPGGLVTKSVFDGAGRIIRGYKTDGGSGSGWSNASVVSGDNILEEKLSQYDGDGNVLLATTEQHFHNDTNTGELGNITTTPLARISYVANYYDAANRLIDSANIGTNGGSAYTYSSSIPARSNTVLVTTYAFNAAGWTSTVTDPRGIKTANVYDNMGRVTQKVENYDGTTSLPLSASSVGTSGNRATNWTYDQLGHVLTITAVMPTGTNSQTTQYNYDVTTTGGSTINSNDLLASVQYPDTSTGSAGSGSTNSQTFTYNAQGQQLTFTDQNGSVHTYSYDLLGRRTVDSVGTLGSGVDGSIVAQTMSYDTGGRPYQLTSYSNIDLASSHIVNQVEDVYNGLGQLTNEYQEHGGAVNTSSSLQVKYAWNLMSSGANNSRLNTVTYPNGRVLHYYCGLHATGQRDQPGGFAFG